MASTICSALLLIFSLCTSVYSERLHEQIYSSIEGGAACFRRLNGTHQAGCSSPENGAVGVVHMIDVIEDAQWMVQNATAGQYVAIVSTALFHDVIEYFMASPATVAGILLYHNATNSPTSFTHESTCPNEYYAANGSNCTSSVPGGWNEKGSGLLRRDIPFPIFYLPETRAEEINKIRQCYEKFNLDKNNQKGSPLCSLQLHSFMFAAVNSEVCMRRSAASAILNPTKVCDPLGDNNVYYSLFPRTNDDYPKKPVNFITARIDSASLFDGISPGAASSVVGTVSLLVAATTLSKMVSIKDAHMYDHNVLWTLFNGESFDYIGSQRVAYDIKNKTWPPRAPLFPGDIRLHVDLAQIGGSMNNKNNDTSWPFNAFVPHDGVIIPITEFLNRLSYNLEKFNMTLTSEVTKNIPPSSVHSFRRILKNETESGQLPELVVADHTHAFTNMFYESALDEFDKIYFNYRNISVDANGTFISTEELLANGTMTEYDPQVKIARFATALVKTLYQTMAGKLYTGNITASAHLVDEILYCFLRNQACRLIMASDYATSNETPPEKPAPMYVGVTSWPTMASVSAGHLLALLTGDHLAVNRTSCDELVHPGYKFYWLRGWNQTGVCVQTTMNFTVASSPAFDIEDYNMTSHVYSTWTESVWATMWVRVFVAASGTGAHVAALAGGGATLLALLLTYWLRRHAAIVFVQPAHRARAASIVNDEAASGILRTVNC